MKNNNTFATQWFPGVFIGVGAFVIFFIANIIFAIIAYPLLPSQHLFFFFSGLFLVIIALSLFILQKKKLYPEISFVGDFVWGDYKVCMLIMIAIAFFFRFISNLFNVPEEAYNHYFYTEVNANTILTCIQVIVFAPLIEEILFRHFILAIFPFNRGGKWAAYAIVFSSLLFTLSHIQYVSTISYIHIFLFAILLALARIVTKGLLLSILLHASNNAIACIVIYFNI